MVGFAPPVNPLCSFICGEPYAEVMIFWTIVLIKTFSYLLYLNYYSWNPPWFWGGEMEYVRCSVINIAVCEDMVPLSIFGIS